MSEQSNERVESLPPRNKLKLGILGAATIPFVVKVAYLNCAWVSSPVDRARLGLWGSIALLIVVAVLSLKLIKRYPTDKPMSKSRALRVLPIPVILYVIGLVLDINAIQLVASVGILWATAWMLYGRESGLMLAPAAVCAVLAVPGSSYWLGKATDGLFAPVAAAYVPAFDVRSQEGYLGREVPATDAFSRFFRTSEAHQFRFASNSNEVSVLSVRIGKDIHEIHPATHCLRSSGWSIRSESLRNIALAGRAEPLSVTEAIAAGSMGSRLLVWVWYSSDTVSTGSFIRFRRLYSPDVAWHTYQLTTFVGKDGDVDGARRRLLAFLSSGGTLR